VRSLRRARDAIKATSDIRQEEIAALRKHVLAVELEAERIEQALLYRAAAQSMTAGASHGADAASADAAIAANVQMFLQSKAGPAGRIDRALPAALIAAAANMVNS
jgi:hypothetical protein